MQLAEYECRGHGKPSRRSHRGCRRKSARRPIFKLATFDSQQVIHRYILEMQQPQPQVRSEVYNRVAQGGDGEERPYAASSRHAPLASRGYAGCGLASGSVSDGDVVGIQAFPHRLHTSF